MPRRHVLNLVKSGEVDDELSAHDSGSPGLLYCFPRKDLIVITLLVLASILFLVIACSTVPLQMIQSLNYRPAQNIGFQFTLIDQESLAYTPKMA